MGRFTSESARIMRKTIAGRAYARKYREQGFPSLAKARAVRQANLAQQRAEKLLEVTVIKCSSRCGCGGATHKAAQLPVDVRKRILGW
jgi:hypothetical protein